MPENYIIKFKTCSYSKYPTIVLNTNVIVDLNSHFGFICEVNESKELSKDLPVTYSYYLENIKPAVPRNQEVKKGWICKICGYVYEGENLPPDFICPICKHGAKDFERIK